jgi:hypothetical protein
MKQKKRCNAISNFMQGRRKEDGQGRKNTEDPRRDDGKWNRSASLHQRRTGVEDPIDAMHFWVIEEEYIFSLYLCGKLAALADAMDTCGKVSMHMPDLYCWRMPLDEEVLRLIDSIKE